MAGNPDLQIMREGLAMHGVSPDNGIISKIAEAYL